MTDEIRPGYYQDEFGEWQKDRRVGRERRRSSAEFPHRDRRTAGRRKADLDFIERDTRQQIQEALDDFAAEHEDHL